MSLTMEALVLQRADGAHLLGPLSLALGPGERLGLVGESGSGKSLVASALFGALPPGVCRTSGSVHAFDIPMDQPGPARDRLRGRRLGWVPQDPLRALNPRLTLGEHLILLPRLHLGEGPAVAREGISPLLARLGLPRSPQFLDRFPQEASGGQRQRILLAMALACDPEVLILDEPTAALDTEARDAFVDLLLEVQQDRRLGWLWITHDPALATRTCERMLVLYGGQALEAGPASRLMEGPRHPYTARLMEAARHHPRREPGFLEAPGHRPSGCPFQSRCPRPQTTCGTWGPWRGGPGDGLRCEAPLERPLQP